jgi:hypothetical protein
MSTKEMHTEDPFYKGVPVEDIPSDNLVEFKIMEDIDGVHIQPWGESVKPQGHCTLMYVHTQRIQFENSEEDHPGYSKFVIPEEFAEDLETSRIHYVTLTKNGRETGIKYRITKVD